MPTITVRFRDVVEGRAYIRLSGEAQIKLCHKAGAPWNDKQPEAKLHDLQQEVLRRRERLVIVHGASRLGKSVLGGCRLICAQMIPFGKIGCIAARYDHVSHEFQYLYKGMRTLFANAPQAFKRLIFKQQANYHDYDCETIWGTRTRGYSTEADEGASLLGHELTEAVLGEGSHISMEILEKRIYRALDSATAFTRTVNSGRELGRMFIGTTPKGYEGCAAAEWERIQKQTKRDPSKLHYGRVPFAESAWVREASILENPAYDRSVYEARKKTLTKAAFDEQYRGKMVFKTGRVYPEFDEDRHTFSLDDLTPERIRKMRLGVAFDTGAYFGAILGGVEKIPGTDRWRFLVLGEVYTEQMHIGYALERVREMLLGIVGRAFLQPEDFELMKDYLDVWGVDSASQHKPEIVEDLDVALTSMKLELIPSIDLVREKMQADEFFVAEECVIFLDQMRKYIWKTTRATGSKNMSAVQEPRKIFDHLLDAMRFVFFPLAREGPRHEPPPAVTWKEAWEADQRAAIFGPLQDALEKAGYEEERLRSMFG